ncbi:MAG: hypothetical protein J2P15_02495 [Micromonosporaceae bacterium]|nr:hypothetical protein [Micromonosporaceae bacterium]
MYRPIVLTRIGAVVVLGVVAAALAAAPAMAQPSAELTVFAGTGVAGSAGDGGPASHAQFHDPNGIAVANNGTVYISDMSNHTVRAVAPDGTIRTVAGTGRLPATVAVQEGVAGTQFDLASPADLAVGPDASLYIADIGLFRVFRLGRDGRIRLVAGTGVRGFAGDGGPATGAQIGQPVGLAVASDGTLYFGDANNARVRRVGPDGSISTVAGDGNIRLTAAGGPATGIAIGVVAGLARDSAGNLWIVDRSSALRRLRGGRLETITEPGPPEGRRWGTSAAATWPPAEGPMENVLGVAADGATVYVLTAYDGLLRLGGGQRLDTVAGVGRHDFGPMAAGVGAVYLVDSGNNRVYVTHPAPPQAEPTAPPAWPRWVWAAGGAGVILLVVIVVVLVRRPAAH